MAKGIDYGRGMTNIDKENGIRYGVIPSNDVLQAWADSSESVYPEPEPCECETCGGSGKHPDPDNADALVECSDCDGSGKAEADDDSMDCVEPIGFVYSGHGYKAESGSDGVDIFITKSLYYTRAAFCSPCAPGACYLRDYREDGDKAYCFAADWFDDSDPCPYPVWEVATDKLVYTPKGI